MSICRYAFPWTRRWLRLELGGVRLHGRASEVREQRLRQRGRYTSTNPSTRTSANTSTSTNANGQSRARSGFWASASSEWWGQKWQRRRRLRAVGAVRRRHLEWPDTLRAWQNLQFSK